MPIPTPRSFNRIMGDMLNAFLSRFGIKSLRVGSPTLAILEAAAQSDMRTSQDIFNLLNSDSLDRATGIALDRIGLGEDLPRLSESATTGLVTVTDTSFSKISTKIYQGLGAPIVGSTTINVSDASSFTSTGSLYLGRGTLNYEGPIAYSATVNNGNYWTITLSTGTKKFHNVGETVILAQGGNRIVPSGTIVQTPQGNTADAVQFAVQFQATIPDGETSVTGIGVIAKKTGVVGNVPAGAINVFAAAPFVGANVTNPLPFTNGLSAEDDIAYRERIKNTKQSRSKGTNLAIKTSLIGITSSDENKRVVSASIVSKQGAATTAYIDDGTGYEERSSGVAQEIIVDSALGGEQFFQLASKRPQSKAFVKSVNAAPYAIPVGAKLSVKVGGTLYNHAFVATDFKTVGNGSAFEVVASINADSSIAFGARTNDSGTTVVLFAKNETNEDIEVVVPASGTDANSALLFPLGRNDTLKLYKNDRLLSKDGRAATILGAPQSGWSTMIGGETLTIAVDGTAATTYTFVDNDFVTANTSFTTLSNANSVDSWVAVINAKIPGITAINTAGAITIVSNVGSSARGSITLSGGTLITKGMFTSVFGLTAVGAASDYTFNRYTGQLSLALPLVAGDTLSTGSAATRAFVQSAALTTIDVTQSGGARLWLALDGGATLIPSSLTTQTTLSFTSPSTNRVRLTAGSGTPFANVLVGDWAIFWDSAFLTSTTTSAAYAVSNSSWTVVSTTGMYVGQPVIIDTGLASEILVVSAVSSATVFTTTNPSNKSHASGVTVSFGNQGVWRVEGVTNTTVDFERTSFLTQTNITLPSTGLTFVRTPSELQPIIIPNGLTYTASALASSINGQIVGGAASVYKGNRLRIATNTFGSTGDIALVAMNNDGLKLGFNTTASAIKNLTSHLPSIESGTLEFGTPTFVSTTIQSVGAGSTSITVSPNTSITSGSEIFGLRDKPVSLSVARYNNTKNHNSMVSARSVTGLNATLSLRAAPASEFTTASGTLVGTGRVSIHAAPAIGPNDTLTIIVDNDALTKRYSFNTYRRLKPTSGTYGTSNSFKDLDNGTVSLFTAFGGSFNWQDYAVYMKARAKTHDNTVQAVLWRYSLFGPGGEQARMGYAYPTGPSLALSMTTDATTNNTVDIRVFLPSGAARTISTIRSTTGFGMCVPAAAVNGIYTYYYIIGYAISSASRTTNVVTAILTLPQGGTDPGLKVGDTIYFKDTTALFGSGAYPIASVNTATNTITFNQTGADVVSQANPGTVSLDTAEATFVGSPVVVGDIVTVGSTATFNISTTTSTETAANGSTATSYMGKTMRVSGLGNQYFSAKSDSNVGTVFSSTNSTLYTASNAIPFWRFLGASATAIQFYPLANNLNTQMATASQSLANAPIIGTALGAGGAITQSSWEENNNAPFWYNLADSVNYVSSVSNYPLDATTDYTLVFKDAITSSLAAGSGCDWANEELRLAPITITGLTNFLNSSGVTGLATVATIQPSTLGDKLTMASQTIGSTGAIQITSGSANTATASIQGSGAAAGTNQIICQINSTDIKPFFGGMWVSLNNTSNFVKTAGSTANFSAINSVGVLDAQSGVGKLWSYGTTNVADSFHGFLWQIEKQGKFVALTYTGLNAGVAPDLTGVTEGMMVAVDAPTIWQTGVTFNAITGVGMSNVFIRPTAANSNGHFYRLTTQSGATGATEPVWPTGSGATVSDGGNVWTEQGLDFLSVSASNQGLFRVVRVDNNSTTLTTGVGTTVTSFTVASTAGLFAGMPVIFDPGTASSETLTINAITSATTFTTTGGTANSHLSNAIIAGPNKTIWIENANAVEEIVAANLTFFDYFASALAGDKIVNNLPALGTANIGTWTVLFPSYKHNFASTLTGYTPRNQYEVVLNTTSKTPVATNASNTANGGLVQVQDSGLARLIKQIATVSQNASNSSKYDVKFTSNAGLSLIGASLGTVMTALDKLNFPITVAGGVDGYSYSTGLIGEAARTLYGDDQNPATYPGVVAAGSQVLISGPIVLRVQISLSIRVRTGVTTTDVTNQVKSAVAGVINKAPIGQAIAISDIVNAASNVTGVLAVSVISPTYNLANDLISVQPYQKPLVQNLDTDVLVSIVGT